MSSPIEIITIDCPKCGTVYRFQYRASMNLMLDNFDDEYIEAMSSGTCPACGFKVHVGALVVDQEGTFVHQLGAEPPRARRGIPLPDGQFNPDEGCYFFWLRVWSLKGDTPWVSMDRAYPTLEEATKAAGEITQRRETAEYSITEVFTNPKIQWERPAPAEPEDAPGPEPTAKMNQRAKQKSQPKRPERRRMGSD